MHKKREIVAGIYTFTNLVNGHIYIGSAIDLDSRYDDHCKVVRTRGSKRLNAALHKHGAENFWYDILEYASPDDFKDRKSFRAHLFEREQFYLNLFYAKEFIDSKGKDDRFRKLTYNISPLACGGASIGREYTDEMRARMSRTQKSRGTSVGKKNPNYGKKQSPETADKIKLAFLKSGRIFPFVAIDSGGDVCGAFLSSGDCAKKLGLWKCMIKRCLKGKYKQVEGYTFRPLLPEDEVLMSVRDVKILTEAGYIVQNT